MATLYLQGCQSSDNELLLCSLSSSVIIFFLRYCQTKRCKLVFVNTQQFADNPCHIRLKNLADLEVTFSSWTNIPDPVQNVHLPSLYQPSLSLIRSGLCVLLRHIIKISHKSSPDLQLIDLLGFREGSMKMCAEVSGWTKLCEVDLPQSISALINTVRELKDNEQRVIKVPSNLMKLEAHFHKKCKVHNDNKIRRAELNRIRKHLSTCCDGDLSCSSFEHEFYTSDEVKTLLYGNNPDYNLADGTINSTTIKSNQELLEQKHKVNIKVSRGSSDITVEQVVHLAHGVRKVRLTKPFPNCPRSVQYETRGSDNLKAQRPSCKGRPEACNITPDDGGIARLMESLSIQDVEYVHTYTEGIEMTLADLILFVYLYYLLEAIDFKCPGLQSHVPSIVTWLCHMATLPAVVVVGAEMGWDVQHATLSQPSQAQQCPGLVLMANDEICEDSDDMELSRCAKMRHKVLKQEILSALNKLQDNGIMPVRGNHPLGDQVQLDWSHLPENVHPKEGDVPENRMFRKCQQLENLATAVQALAKPGNFLVDFCSGGGHLGILMAYLMPDCQIYLVENKEESLLKACSRITSLGLDNITLYQCNLDYFTGSFDVGTSLHACGSATDMVLQLCLQARASFVVCPCCYGSIQNTHLLNYPQSKLFRATGITYKEYLTLGHAADQTEHNITIEDRGHLCMDMIDTDRAQYAMDLGYDVTLTSLKPLNCTPKSNLLIGKPLHYH